MSQSMIGAQPLPDLNGKVVRILRKRKSKQIIFLTVRASERDLQAAFQQDTTRDFQLARNPVG